MGDREWSQRVSLATVVTLAFTRREIVFHTSFSVSAHNPSYLFPNSHIHPPPFCLPSSHPISGCHQLLNSHGNVTKPCPFSCFFPHSPLALSFHIILPKAQFSSHHPGLRETSSWYLPVLKGQTSLSRANLWHWLPAASELVVLHSRLPPPHPRGCAPSPWRSCFCWC